MCTHQDVKIDERTVAVANASHRWAYNFLTVALCIDVFCRAAFFDEAAWDLFALLGVSGAIGMVYMVRYKVLNWPSRKGMVIVFVVTIVVALVAAVVGAISAMTKVM